ncbi:MAG: class I SAM-dependent RNA methyltransferase, partial [Spirochaetaceae bacterium]|nr:class I SAM-dependent RNA methyltransferase [Spirochaetaceae bacterium]
MYTLAALCAIGAEKFLGTELKRLGFALNGGAPGRVYFSADAAGMYRANLCLRIADRVFLQAAAFDAPEFDALFDGVYAAPWQDLLRKDSRIIVDKVRTNRSALASEHTVQAMVHKGIYKKLGDKWHMATLPETGDTAAVRVYIDGDRARIMLDLSGEPLHKRGYRTQGGIAPLRETVAAALIQMALWRRKTPLHDPFCGAGTIPSEALLYALDAAPGFGRCFALERLPFFDPRLAAQIRREEAAKIRTDVLFRITGSDMDNGAVERARLNAEHACVTVGRAL